MNIIKPSIVTNFLSRIENRLVLEYESLIYPSIEVEIDGVKIKADRSLSKLMRQALRKGLYEDTELNLLKKQLSHNDIVMEFGAGIGFLSAYCAKKIGSNKVFAYEANLSMQDHIQKTYKLNHVFPILQMCLIGDKAGEQNFYIEKNFVSSSIIQRHDNAKCVKVPVISFNDEVKRINPTFLIIDIEGGEYNLCQYANLNTVQKIVIELHGHILGREKTEFVKSKLVQSGFLLKEKFQKEEAEILFLQRT